MQIIIRPLLLVLLASSLAACASSPSRSVSAASSAPVSPAAVLAADHAVEMVGKPYRYGGYTPAGFDCSGLVHYSFARAGLRVPRDTGSLRRVGNAVSPSGLTKGDLVFFDQEGKKSSHVGIYLGNGRFVHAPSTGGRVRVDQVHSPYWSRHLNEVRRL
ncbi:MAG TPA: C40 family peptidase [Burkholderiales bacterium]|nr:C40 family peptidase [Burkholderiales bacterium]